MKIIKIEKPESVVGENLISALSRIDAETWQTCPEIFRHWDNYAKGRKTPANLGIYTLTDKGPAAMLLGRKGNPLVDENTRFKMYMGIRIEEYFLPPQNMQTMIEQGLENPLILSYNGLELSSDGRNKDYGLLKPDPENPQICAFFKKAYGTALPGKGRGIRVLRPETIERVLADNPKAMIVRGCNINENGTLSMVYRFPCGETETIFGMIPDQNSPDSEERSHRIKTSDYKKALDTVVEHPDYLSFQDAKALIEAIGKAMSRMQY